MPLYRLITSKIEILFYKLMTQLNHRCVIYSFTTYHPHIHMTYIYPVKIMCCSKIFFKVRRGRNCKTEKSCFKYILVVELKLPICTFI